MRSCWEILGIDQTGDLRVIKKAYAAELKKHNPEEDPQGFMELRQAYEQAQSIAQFLQNIGEEFLSFEDECYIEEGGKENAQEEDNEDEEDDSVPPAPSVPDSQPISDEQAMWECLQALYNDFFKRIKVESWKNMIYDLDLRQEAALYDIAVDFFSTHCCMPREVWDYVLRFCGDHIFPYPWLEDHTIDLDYDCFDPEIDRDYAQYADLRIAAYTAYLRDDFVNVFCWGHMALRLFDGDPGMYIMLGNSHDALKHTEDALAAYQDYLEFFPSDSDIRFKTARLLRKLGRHPEAIREYETLKALKFKPFETRRAILECRCESGMDTALDLRIKLFGHGIRKYPKLFFGILAILLFFVWVVYDSK